MKSSCHFFFNHLGTPTQFSDSNSPVSVLHGTNLYSVISSIYFHWSSLSVSWQRIYNTFTLDKSSNHTLSLRRSTSTTNLPWLLPSTNSFWLSWKSLYTAVVQTQIAGNTSRDIYCCVTSPRITGNTCHVIPTHRCVTSPRMRCIATVHVRTQRINFHSTVARRMR
jgi:hypothetical protein